MTKKLDRYTFEKNGNFYCNNCNQIKDYSDDVCINEKCRNNKVCVYCKVEITQKEFVEGTAHNLLDRNSHVKCDEDAHEKIDKKMHVVKSRSEY